VNGRLGVGFNYIEQSFEPGYYKIDGVEPKLLIGASI
jgi:hypothetical protein